ncbi:hypothetical protein C8J56DRAFT_1159861 [Mycena floridula]|nr:hypothetical protein C8J56DRAFT_1159861 [Mycena floridula]
MSSSNCTASSNGDNSISICNSSSSSGSGSTCNASSTGNNSTSICNSSSSGSESDGKSADSPVVSSGGVLSTSTILTMSSQTNTATTAPVAASQNVTSVPPSSSVIHRGIRKSVIIGSAVGGIAIMLLIICGIWLFLRTRRRRKQKRTYPVLFVNDSPPERVLKHRRDGSASDPGHQRNPSTVTLEEPGTRYGHSDIAPPSYSESA